MLDWFFDIVSKMKGHVGGGSGFYGFQGVDTRSKFRPFHIVLLHIHSECNCAGNGSLKMAAIVMDYSSVMVVGHQT